MRLCKFVLALGLVALVCSPALAQGRRGGGGMGGFGTSLATLAQNNSVRIMRQFGSRLAIAPLAQSLGGRSMHVDMVRAGAGNSTPKRNIVARWCRRYGGRHRGRPPYRRVA